MDIDYLMNLNIENLKQEKNKALTNFAVKKLQEVITHLQKKNYTAIEKMLILSPAGDGMGEDNYFINFGYNEEEKDLGDFLNELKRLL